jgi:protein TIF31
MGLFHRIMLVADIYEGVGSISLKDYFPPLDLTAPPKTFLQCICFSTWNSMSSKRRIHGDLFYLDVVVNEGSWHCITASEDGFFVNCATLESFNPSRSLCYSQFFPTLPNLLSAISPHFRRSFAANEQRSKKHFLDDVFPSEWIGEVFPHTRSALLAQQYLLKCNGLATNNDCAILLPERDWNEEFQSLYEKILNNGDQPLLLRKLLRVHCDFVAAAQSGAIAVLNGEVPPLNRFDSDSASAWLFRNIVFIAIDKDDGTFSGFGGDVAAHKNALHELNGVNIVYKAKVAGVFVCGLVVVDYRGRRVLCQSIVPGLLACTSSDGVGASMSRHIYGASYDLKSFHCDNEFEKLAHVLSKKLGVKNSQVTFGDEIQTIQTIYGPLEMHGFIGADNRRYFYDLHHLLPRDLNFPSISKSYCLLRPELVKRFLEYYCRGEECLFNVNLGVHSDRLSFENANDKQSELSLLQEAALFLLNVQIPEFVELVSYSSRLPTDCTALVPLMHEWGINARYLGIIATTTKDPSLVRLCKEEIVTRSAKAVLRVKLSKCTLGESAVCVADFMNHFLGCVHGGSVWDEMKLLSEDRFSFSLTIDETLRKLSLLRSLCLSMGITLHIRDYQLDTALPFSPQDVLSFFPLVHHTPPQLHYVQSLVDEPDQLSTHIESFESNLSTLYEDVGPNLLSASCHQSLARTYSSFQEFERALHHAESASLLLERFLGHDHFKTVQSYRDLALYYHNAGHCKKALVCIQRVLYLDKLVSGSSAIATLDVVSMIKQDQNGSDEGDDQLFIPRQDFFDDLEE